MDYGVDASVQSRLSLQMKLCRPVVSIFLEGECYCEVRLSHTPQATRDATMNVIMRRQSVLVSSRSFRRIVFLLLLSFLLQLEAQSAEPDFKSYGAALKPQQPDPAIAAALREISPEHVRGTIETLVGFGNRNTLGGMEAGSPSGASHPGVAAAADWIEAELNRYSAACGNCLEVKRDTFTEQPQSRIPKPTVITNVYAVLRGSDPSQAARINLVTGHYDSRNTDVLDAQGTAPGANDDASGVAVSLECARVLSRHKWPSTLVFVAVAGEEQGLNGSRHLAHFAREQGWRVESVLNDDIVGGNTTPGDILQNKSAIRVFSEGIPAASSPEQIKRILNLGAESDSPSREVAREITEVARTYTASQTGPEQLNAVLELRRDRYLRGGDHTSFNAEGFPAVRFTEWREDFDHQHQNLRTENGKEYGDLLKFVDFNYVASVARLNAAALAAMASAPGVPLNVRIVTKALDNNSTLQWDAPEGAPSGIRYEIVWRQTAAPDWQFAADPLTGNTATLPVSKDNVIFGVRSLDAAGHRSPAAVPQ